MKNRAAFGAIALALLVVVSGLVSATLASPRAYTFHREEVMGTSLDLRIVARSQRQAERAEAVVLAAIARESAILSAYDPESEFRRWFATSGVPVRVSPELLDVLSLYERWRLRTNGALDASTEAASRIWKEAARAGRVPTSAELAAAVAAMRQTHWFLDAEAVTATHLTDVPLTLNSFTKSYIIDRAAAAALASGQATAVVVNAGGDIVVRGDWVEPVGIADPLADAENAEPIARLAVGNRAVATSGGYRRGLDVDGRHYSHIVDPRTAQPTGHVLSATVVAPDAATAGALATAFCVLSAQESRALAASVPGVEFMLVLRDGGRVESAGWHTLADRPARRPAVAALPTVYAAGQGTWDPSMELTVTLELARAEGGGARRPYVAVWIDDKDRFPVRTLALWFQKARWLPELRAWYRDDRVRALAETTDLASTISSATRPAGKYTLKWDGKDNQGAPVKRGTYTVCIEVVREHGTYQMIRQELDFSGIAKRLDLPGNAEVAAAALDYQKRDAR